MAEKKAAEVQKKGFFSKKKSEPAAAPPKGAQPAARPAAAPKPAPAPKTVEPRLSLESMPEVEKRIDRMQATQRRASLLERYENRYGEKLEVPNVFVPVEEEKPSSAEADRPGTPEISASVTTKPAAAPSTEKAATPALPPKDVRPAEPKPVAADAKLAAVVGKPAQPAAQKPAAAPKPSKPSPVNFKSFLKYLWPYWRLPFRTLAKYNSPENKGKIMAYTIVDILVWILLALPRIVLCPIGFIWEFLKKRKAKQANGENVEVAAVAD
jgi:hypothetical protein